MERTSHWSSRASSDTVSFTFTYHTWQFIIIFSPSSRSPLASSLTRSVFHSELNLALRQIISSIDHFLSYRTDSTDSYPQSVHIRTFFSRLQPRVYFRFAADPNQSPFAEDHLMGVIAARHREPAARLSRGTSSCSLRRRLRSRRGTRGHVAYLQCSYFPHVYADIYLKRKLECMYYGLM